MFLQVYSLRFTKLSSLLLQILNRWELWYSQVQNVRINCFLNTFSDSGVLQKKWNGACTKKPTSPKSLGPTAWTSVAMIRFERLVKAQYVIIYLPRYNSLYFVYQHSRSVQNVLSLVLHTALEQLEGWNVHVKLLFIDFSSLSTIKLTNMGLGHFTRAWVYDFLSGTLHF